MTSTSNTLSSEQCEGGHLQANSEAPAQRFIEDMELAMINQDHVQT